MAKSCGNELKQKVKKLYDFIFAKNSIENYEKKIEPQLIKAGEETYYAVFFSVCNTKSRAIVVKGTGLTLAAAWDSALEKAVTRVNKDAYEPAWVKTEIIIQSQESEPQQLVDKIFGSYKYYYRKGLSLDAKYNYAYTEGELNCLGLLNYKDKVLDLRTFNKYSMQRDEDVILFTPSKLISFVTDQYFIDDRGNVFSLYNEGLGTGRRELTELNQKEILKLIQNSARYLMKQIHVDGTFDYGFYPLNNSAIPGYNIMRHTSSIWSLICAAEITKDKEIYRQAQLTIKYLISQIRVYEDGLAYVIEKDASEIKLGANGVAIILLTQYMKLYGTDEYVEICDKLGHGILRMMIPETGGFIHVLNANDRSIKDEYRTVYYDGEAAFALSKLYSLTGSKLWLMAAGRAVDHFIEEDYTKYRDHWVAYAVNELTKHNPQSKYLEFGLRNVMVNLDTIYNQKTTYHTYLEMLMASLEIYERAKNCSDNQELTDCLKQFDAGHFAETIIHRANRMLDGYAYPEYVMYFRKPARFKNSFFVRHDRFRTRIDDVQHNCASYIALYQKYDVIMGMLESKS